LKAAATIARWLFSLCLLLLLLTASIGWAVNSLWLYEAGFDKYQVDQTTGLPLPELEKAARGLMGYFNSGEEYISLTAVKEGESFQLFNQREVVHLRDVKDLIRLDYRVLLGTLVYALAYVITSFFWRRRSSWRQLARGLVWGSGITLALMLAFGLGTLLNFDQLFLRFHLLSFANDFWQLDPSRDYLIMLFPQGFWFDAALLVAGATTGLALILGGIGGGYLLRSRINAASED
jgi:integral membrane protein (TIGR01906 family)